MSNTKTDNQDKPAESSAPNDSQPNNNQGLSPYDFGMAMDSALGTGNQHKQTGDRRPQSEEGNG